MQKVYIVKTPIGEYETYFLSIIGIYTDKEKAISEMKKSNKIFDQYKELCKYSDKIESMHLWNIPKEDWTLENEKEDYYKGYKEESPFSKKDWEDYDDYEELHELICYNNLKRTFIEIVPLNKIIKETKTITDAENN